MRKFTPEEQALSDQVKDETTLAFISGRREGFSSNAATAMEAIQLLRMGEYLTPEQKTLTGNPDDYARTMAANMLKPREAYQGALDRVTGYWTLLKKD